MHYTIVIEKKRGASVVNKALPKGKKISWSVIDLRTWKDQTKAAYMFALCNLNSAVRKLTNEEAASLLEYQKNNKENLRFIWGINYFTDKTTISKEKAKSKKEGNLQIIILVI